MSRITNVQIEAKQMLLNKTLGNPIETYRRSPKGDCVAQVGNIHMKGVHNYWNIEQISHVCGSTKQLAGGFSKRQVFEWYQAALEGIFLYQKSQEVA
tara:strand:- start:552 stop:842 length:291 start_codon:yes stop_codon:yes gene_type:complete